MRFKRTCWSWHYLPRGGVRVLNEKVIRSIPVSDTVIESVAARELIELRRRELAYRSHATAPEVSGKTIILVDDGIATGSTMCAAVAALHKQRPVKIVVAAPTALRHSARRWERTWTK